MYIRQGARVTNAHTLIHLYTHSFIQPFFHSLTQSDRQAVIFFDSYFPATALSSRQTILSYAASFALVNC